MGQLSHDQIIQVVRGYPQAVALYESLRDFYGDSLLIEEQTPDQNQSMSRIDLDGTSGRLRSACVRLVLSGETMPASLAHELLHLALAAEGFPVLYGWDVLPGMDVQRVGPWYEAVANVTAHELMLDRFLALGFPRSAFLNRVAERESPAALADATARALQAGLSLRIVFSNYCVEYLSTWATARHLEDAGLRDAADEIERRGRDLHPAFGDFGNIRDAFGSVRLKDPSQFAAACDDLMLRMGMTKGWYYRLHRDERGSVFAQKVK